MESGTTTLYIGAKLANKGNGHHNEIPSERKRISFYWDTGFRSDGKSFLPGIRYDGILFMNLLVGHTV